METIDLGQLQKDPDNPRKHDRRNIQAIVDSLLDVGAARSIVIDEHNETLAGNGVVEAARIAGLQKVIIIDSSPDTLVAVRRTDLSDDQKRRLAVYDNRGGELATWDTEVLKALEATDPDMIERLFTGAEWDTLMQALDQPADDEAGQDAAGVVDQDTEAVARENVTEKWGVQVGDLWEVKAPGGRVHRLYCGDALDADTVGIAAGPRGIQAVIAEPPWEVGGRAFAVWGAVGGVQIWWGAQRYAAELPSVKGWLVWDRQGGKAEDAILGWCNAADENRVCREKQAVGLHWWSIQNFAYDAGVVAVPFLGSGAGILACEKAGVAGIGVDGDPKKVAGVLERLARGGMTPERV